MCTTENWVITIYQKSQSAKKIAQYSKSQKEQKRYIATTQTVNKKLRANKRTETSILLKLTLVTSVIFSPISGFSLGWIWNINLY